MTRRVAWLAVVLLGVGSALAAPLGAPHAADPTPDAQMLLDLDLLKDADLARDRNLLTRMRLVERLRAQCDQIVAYAYGDWLSRFGDLQGLARQAGLSLVGAAANATASLATFE